MKKVISAFLCTVLLFSFICIDASAYSFEKQKPVYVALGDSVCSGYGLDDFNVNVIKDAPLGFEDYPESCYASLIGKELGYDTYNLSVCGLSAPGFNKLMNGVDTFHDLSSTATELLLGTFTSNNYSEILFGKGKYADLIKKASVISVNVGGNDFLIDVVASVAALGSQALTEIVSAFSMGSIGDDKIPVGTSDDAFISALFDMVKSIKDGTFSDEEMRSLANAIVKFCDQSFLRDMFMSSAEKIMKSYDEFVPKLKRINPRAKIVLIGFNNNYEIYSLLSDVMTEIASIVDNGIETKGHIMNGIFNLSRIVITYQYQSAISVLNSHIKNLCKKQNVTFVDISGAPSSKKLDPHPNSKGHAYIANRVLDSLLPAKNLYVSSGKGGSVAVVGADATYKKDTYTVKATSLVSVMPVADKGYEIKSVIVNGKNLSANDSGVYEIGRLYKNTAVTVKFSKKPTEKTVSSGKAAAKVPLFGRFFSFFM